MLHTLRICLIAATCTFPKMDAAPATARLTDGVARSTDGVPIAYTFGGDKGPALVFIHGGFANRGFWSGQLGALAPQHRVVALDLAGHGASGRDRKHRLTEVQGP
jgi:alpha-beta hydrolase superfamily lysophospholipase